MSPENRPRNPASPVPPTGRRSALRAAAAAALFGQRYAAEVRPAPPAAALNLGSRLEIVTPETYLHRESVSGVRARTQALYFEPQNGFRAANSGPLTPLTLSMSPPPLEAGIQGVHRIFEDGRAIANMLGGPHVLIISNENPRFVTHGIAGAAFQPETIERLTLAFLDFAVQQGRPLNFIAHGDGAHAAAFTLERLDATYGPLSEMSQTLRRNLSIWLVGVEAYPPSGYRGVELILSGDAIPKAAPRTAGSPGGGVRELSAQTHRPFAAGLDKLPKVTLYSGQYGRSASTRDYFDEFAEFLIGAAVLGRRSLDGEYLGNRTAKLILTGQFSDPVHRSVVNKLIGKEVLNDPLLRDLLASGQRGFARAILPHVTVARGLESATVGNYRFTAQEIIALRALAARV